MITTLMILTFIIVVPTAVHKALLKAADSYEFETYKLDLNKKI